MKLNTSPYKNCIHHVQAFFGDGAWCKEQAEHKLDQINTLKTCELFAAVENQAVNSQREGK